MKKTKAICSHHGCWTLTTEGKCKKHKRSGPRDRGYDLRWERFRKDYIKRHPACSMCGKVVTSPHLHHIVDIKAWPSGRFSEDNVRTLCQPCHNKVTKR